MNAWLIYLLLVPGYAFGAIVSGCMFSAIGQRNPSTTHDSWTGDTSLDLWSILLWPAAWFVLVALRVGNRIAGRA